MSNLEASYIIYLLPSYHTNFGKRLVKMPKLYFYDSGLACYLLRIKQNELATHPSRGSLFEGLIITDILKHYYKTGKIPQIYF